MISFSEGDCRFNYRVAGVAVREGRLLLHRFQSDGFWTLPGGRAEMGEVSSQTLIREMEEETGLKVIPTRLIWMAENFFIYHGRKYHELGLFYEMELENEGVAPFTGAEGNHLLEFRWFSPEEIEQETLYPAFLRSAWTEIGPGVRHFIEDSPDPRKVQQAD
ncbi:MAG: NUDIX domain-containing protein [Bacteroidetes bacterium]|nr:MAG: NUDIX domain-containing protein [Bacteroidota bacterium]